MPGNILELCIQRLQHPGIARLLVCQEESVESLGAEADRAVGPPHIIAVERRLPHGGDIVVTRAAGLARPPPDRLIVEVIAPLKRGIDQSPIPRTPALKEHRHAMVQPVHPKRPAMLRAVVVASNIPPIISNAGRLNDGVMMVTNQPLNRGITRLDWPAGIIQRIPSAPV